jgi:hypothetical protein
MIAPYVRISEGQMAAFASWCRDYGQALFDPIDPISNPVDLVESGWDAAFEKFKELGINFHNKKSLKRRMHCWRIRLKNYRDHSKITGIAMNLSAAELILQNLWFENRLNQRF